MRYVQYYVDPMNILFDMSDSAQAAEGNFSWGVELIKCIDPNEGEALKRVV